MSNRRNTGLDAPWRHNAVTAPMIYALGVFAAGVVLRATIVPPWYVAAITGAGVIVAVLAAIVYGASRSVCWYAFLVATGTAAWITYTRFTTPWSKVAVLALAAGALVIGPFYAAVRYGAHRARLAELDEAARLEKYRRDREWPQLLDSLGFRGLRTVERGGSENVESVTLKLPADGSVLYSRLHRELERIEVAAGLRYGSLRIERGGTADLVQLHVVTADVLAQTHQLPITREPRSINQPFDIGKYETGEVCAIRFREIAGLIAGLRGSGKSALLNTMLSRLTGCTDAVIWMIDAKGGRTARPWLEPWLDGKTNRPVIDWVATTDAEIDAMLAAAKAVVMARASSLLGEKVRPTPNLPAIILICEEIAIIFGTRDIGNSKRAALGTDIVQLGRSEAVDPVLITQRATVTMLGSGDLKSQVNLRIGLGVASDADARLIFPDTKLSAELLKLATDDRYVGAFVLQAPGQQRPVPVKGYWTDPDLIPGIAYSNAEYGPRLDEGSARAAHDAVISAGQRGGYHDRWDRYLDPLGRVGARRSDPLGGTTTVTRDPAGPVPPVTPAPPVTRDPGGWLPWPEGHPAREAAERRARERAGDTGQADAGGDSPGDTARATGGDSAREDTGDVFAGIVQNFQVLDDDPETPPAGNVPLILKAVSRVFVALEVDRLHTQRLLDELPGDMSAKRLSQLLSSCGVRAAAEPFEVDGTRARGYLADDVFRAHGQIQSGKVKAPDYAHTWDGEDSDA